MKTVVEILQERGLFDNITNPDLLQAVQAPLTVYAGFDPTSDSLQAGNYVAIMALTHFQRCGHRVVALVGGATGMIGDPSGKSAERSMLSVEQVRQNAEGIRENLGRFLDFNRPTAPAILVNNYDWLGSFNLIDFLRDVGKHFRLGAMLGKDSVKLRLNSEAGMSFTEFTYQMLQGYDFLHLYDNFGCTLQIGGGDQWGNITAGIDLIHRLRGVPSYGLTIPLVCDSAGRKFGKSEGNALYLDARKTSVYTFYQFFIRTADADAIRYLKIFTYLPMEDIHALEVELRERPEQRAAQKRLAEEVTRAVHGESGLQTAQRASAVMFGESMDGLRAEDLMDVFADVASVELPRAAVAGAALADVAVAAGLCKSKGEARRLAESGGLYLNNRRMDQPAAVVQPGDIVDDRIVVLRSGKKNFRLVRVQGG